MIPTKCNLNHEESDMSGTKMAKSTNVPVSPHAISVFLSEKNCFLTHCKYIRKRKKTSFCTSTKPPCRGAQHPSNGHGFPPRKRRTKGNANERMANGADPSPRLKTHTSNNGSVDLKSSGDGSFYTRSPRGLLQPPSVSASVRFPIR